MLIWWEHLSEIKTIRERNLDWEKFWKCFKEKYLIAKYYDGQRREFHELKLGPQCMEEHFQKFMELLWYVDYIREEKVKIESLLSGLPYNYIDRIEFPNPQTLEETI